jgi:hypothetical protein
MDELPQGVIGEDREDENAQIRIVMSVDGEGASRYFDRALTAGDYYASQVGVWGGKERNGFAWWVR